MMNITLDMPRSPSSRRPGRPKGDDGASYKTLIAAARSLFLHYPYKSVTIRTIAEEGGVDTALIRYYFGNKEGLYRAVIRDLYQPQIARMRKLQRDDTPPGVEDLFQLFLETSLSNPELPLFIYRTIVLEEGPGREFLLEDVITPLDHYIDQIFDRMQADNSFCKKIDVAKLRDAFVSLCLNPFLLRPLFVEQLGEAEADAKIEQMVRFNGALFRRALEEPDTQFPAKR